MYIKGRIKSAKYRKFERDCLLLLPGLKLPEKPYLLKLEFGIAPNADASNYIKVAEDILQAKYKFNDRWNYRIEVVKVDCKPKEKYWAFSIESLVVQ